MSRSLNLRNLRFAFSSVAFALALAASAVGCHPNEPVAPSWDGRVGAPVADKDFPIAAAHYAFSHAGTAGRTDLARPLADRLLIRSKALFAAGRERAGLSAVRLAAMMMRTNKAAPDSLSNDAIAAFEAAVTGPAARGEEGPSIGIYLFWSVARPADQKPKQHLDALAKWTGSPADFPPSALVSVARESVRRSEALGYSPSDADRAASDKTLLEWMDQVVAFKEGERTPARYGDEVYSAVLGYRTSGVRLVVGHLRDGDVGGAVEAISAPQTQGFIPDALRRALLDAGSTPSLDGYEQVVAALIPNAKLEGMEDSIADAVMGTSLAATGDHPQSGPLAEVVARGFFLAGSGDVAPAVLARALLGTKDDPRRPPAKDLGRALAVSAAAIRDFADREEYDAARRTYASSEPLLLAADRIGGISPSTAMVKTLMGLVEGEAGHGGAARALFEDALKVEPLATAYAGRARIEAKEGDLVAARASIEKALATKGTDAEPALTADLSMLAGDYARRAGDMNSARAAYERALKLLVPMRQTAKGGMAAEINARIAAILSHFADAESKEDEAASFAESAGSGDSRAVARLAMTRFLRAIRTVNAARAKEAFRRSQTIGLTAEDQVRAAVIARAIAKRAGLADDGEIMKVINNAATRDDHAGRMAKFALGQLDAATLLARSPSPRRGVNAKLVIAITAWGNGGVEPARKDLEAVTHAEVIGLVDGELALEALDPQKGAIPGAPKGIPGL